MITFFNGIGACSIGIHVLLEEAGADFENRIIDLANREQFSPDYRAANPKGKVPAILREDGSLVTEFPAIALWIGHTYPEARMLPADFEGQLRVIEVMDYMVSSIHMRGFTFIFAPMKFHPDDPSAQEALRAHGRDQVKIGLDNLAETLGDKDWLLGDFTVAEGALFYMTRWCHQHGIEMPDNIRDHHQRMIARPAVQRALRADGLATPEKSGLAA